LRASDRRIVRAHRRDADRNHFRRLVLATLRQQGAAPWTVSVNGKIVTMQGDEPAPQ
jgi:hypothetical protein